MTQDNLCLGCLRLVRVGGDEHVVGRDRSMIHAVSKESIFVSLVQDSQSFFYQGNGCNLLQLGELVVYRVDKPYLFGFSGPMRQFIFNIPQDGFTERCLRDFKGPLKISTESPVWCLLVRILGERIRDFPDSSHGKDAERYQEEAYNLLASIISDYAGGHRVSALGASYLLAVKQCIQQRLDEPTLNCERVTAATGISSQRLARLLAQEGNSPGRYLQERRLERAYQLLASPQGRCPDVAKVAYRHDPSSQAHFARTSKTHYGVALNGTRDRQTRLPYLSFSYRRGSVP